MPSGVSWGHALPRDCTRLRSSLVRALLLAHGSPDSRRAAAVPRRREPRARRCLRVERRRRAHRSEGRRLRGLRRRQAADRSRASADHARAPDPADRARQSDQRARHAPAGGRRGAGVHAVLRSLFVSALGFVSRAQADHRDARPRDRPGRHDRRDDAGHVARLDHLQPPHRQHRALRHRHLALGRARSHCSRADAAGAGARECYRGERDPGYRRRADRAAARTADARCARRRWSRTSKACGPNASS